MIQLFKNKIELFTNLTLVEECPIFSHAGCYILTLATPLGLTDNCKKNIVTGTLDITRQDILEQVTML